MRQRDHQEDTAALIAKQIAGDQDTVYDQRGDAEWLTGKEVSEGAKRWYSRRIL